MSQVVSGRCVRSVLAFVVLVLPLAVLGGRLQAEGCEYMAKSIYCPDTIPAGWTYECSNIVFFNQIGKEFEDEYNEGVCNDASQTDRQKGPFDCMIVPKAIEGCVQALDHKGRPLETYCYLSYKCEVKRFGNQRSCYKTTDATDRTGVRTFNAADKVNCSKTTDPDGPP